MLVCFTSSFVRDLFFCTVFCLSYVCHSCLLKQHSKGFGDFPTIKLKSLSWLVFSNARTFSRHFLFSQLSIGYIYQHGVAINMYLLMYLYKSAVCFLIICNSSFKKTLLSVFSARKFWVYIMCTWLYMEGALRCTINTSVLSQVFH